MRAPSTSMKCAAGWQSFLDPSRRPRGENGKAAGQNEEGGQDRADNPGNDGHFLTFASAAKRH